MKSKISIDEGRNEIVFGDKRITVSRLEWELLRALVKSGKTISREDLIENVWGKKSLVDTRTVDQHVARLRRKLPAHLIETVPTFGYRIALNTIA